MGFKALLKNRWFRIISNKYVLILLLFGVWMLFLDSNSWLVHQELNEDINELKDNRTFYNAEITHDTTIINGLKDSSALERFAREEYFMKKKNEEIYIIEYDSTPKK
ncbi:septum formation initiator family protein [Mesonia sp. MT50]|uniref:Septum formation initiator family protein n=1 Tax=Mesonia profundi TaxID=3070998 RepID=A0ABU0ZYD5_9FLAO|nr:septum formation initiator family protein [Mesonia profundi]MDQ7916475.1 septum formation initiator family protein [Mesonia profundi]